LPSFIYTAASRGIPAEANVLASAVFILAIAGVVTAQVGGAIRRKRLGIVA
jgi:spermidine/putrescine transport system permease protein